MSGLVSSSAVEEEFLWSCSLTAASKEYTWNPEVTYFTIVLTSASCNF